jgi:Rieske 2Fe-2S family protein
VKPRTAHGQRTLPGEYFTSPDVWREEQTRIFQSHWLLAGHVSALRYEGDYLTLEVAGSGVIVVRGAEGHLYAHHNICRHRGTRLCEDRRGTFGGGAIRCPYHSWLYTFDGTLAAAPHMREVTGFDASRWNLKRAALAQWHGFVFVNLAENPVPFADALPQLDAREGKFERWPLAELRSAHQTAYNIDANWKLFFHNYSECYHCPGAHPQLNSLTPFRNSENDLEEGAVLGGPMTLSNPQGSMTTHGERCAPPFAALNEADRGRVYYYTLFPSGFISLHPDYVLVHRIEPLDIGRTRVTCDWYFHRDAMAASGFSAKPAVEFWDNTNRQDWLLCEGAQAGMRSAAWEPGPYSELESQLAAFDRHYLRVLQGA